MKVQGAIFVTLKSVWALTSHFNPIALRKTKIVYNFGLSECSRVKVLQQSFLCDGQGTVMRAILHVDRSCFQRGRK